MHRQKRLKVLEMQCEDRAVDCPVEERRAVAEQAKIWSQCRQRARRDYVFAQRELEAMIEQREILEATESWPGYLRGLRADKRAQRAAAEARMAEPGHDRASDPDPDNPVFLDPEGCAFLHGIDEPHGGFEATERMLEPCRGDAVSGGTNEPEPLCDGNEEAAGENSTDEPDGRARMPAEDIMTGDTKNGTNDPERSQADAESRACPGRRRCTN